MINSLLTGTLYVWITVTILSLVEYELAKYDYKHNLRSNFPAPQFDEGPLVAFLGGWFYGGLYCLGISGIIAIIRWIPNMFRND
jgi:hypothetical protein